MNNRMGTLVSILAAVWILLAVMGPAPSGAAGLDRQVEAMMAEFETAIRSHGGDEPFLIAAGSFFDPATRAREPLCRDAEARVFEQILKRFMETGGAVIVDWKRPEPLKAAKDAASGKMHYLLSDAVRHLEKAPFRGFLITGYADSPGGGARLRAELIEIPGGTVAERFGPPVVAEETGTLAAAPLSAMKEAPAPTPEPSAKVSPEAPLAESAPEASEKPQADADDTAPAASASPEPPAKKTSAVLLPPPAADEAQLASTVIEGKNFRYEGQVDAEGQKHGHGTLIFDSGDRYTGQWANNRMNGEGTYEFANGARYVGQWRDNRMHGRGTYYYPNGDRYKGRFANDVKDGPGTYFFENGDRWEGSYLRGRKHGKAVYIWENGQRKEELWDQGRKVE